MQLHCRNCGNTKEFFAVAVERHTWIVDGTGSFIKDVECSDSDHIEVQSCCQCLSTEIDHLEK